MVLLFWLFVCVVFEDGFWLCVWYGLLWVVVVFYGVMICLWGGWWLGWVLLWVVFIIFVVLGLVVVVGFWCVDLVEKWCYWCGLVVGGGVFYVFVMVVLCVGLVDGSFGDGVVLVDVVMMLVFVSLIVWCLL